MKPPFERSTSIHQHRHIRSLNIKSPLFITFAVDNYCINSAKVNLSFKRRANSNSNTKFINLNFDYFSYERMTFFFWSVCDQISRWFWLISIFRVNTSIPSWYIVVYRVQGILPLYYGPWKWRLTLYRDAMWQTDHLADLIGPYNYCRISRQVSFCKEKRMKDRHIN